MSILGTRVVRTEDPRLLTVGGTTLNPLGAKGIGEAGTTGALPSAQSAVIGAVSHLGVRHIDLPATPGRVWAAISEARTAQ